MASRSRNAGTCSNRRTIPVSDVDRFRLFGSIVPNGNPEIQATALSTSYLNPGIQSAPSNQSIPPPLPPRADASRYSRYSNYSGMNSIYSPYSRFSPGMYSAAYGGYRTPYSRYGMPPDSYNSFIQLAEERSRPAFESIESVVDIVGSISMMLESTYHAVYSSYHAILGVVDQFSRLKDHLAEVLSFLALLRGLKYLCLKILYLLRLKKDNPSVEAAWSKAATSASNHSDFSQFNKKSPWPFFMFVGLVIGAPWLMFKLLARSVSKKSFDISVWKNKGGYCICQANYDFNSTRRGELSFCAGESLYIAPKHLQANVPRGWMLACNKNNKIGLIPSNYLKSQQTSSGSLRIVSQKVQIPVDNATHATNNTSEMGKIPENSTELTKNIPIDPFIADEDPVTPEIMPTPSLVDEFNENEEQ